MFASIFIASLFIVLNAMCANQSTIGDKFSYTDSRGQMIEVVNIASDLPYYKDKIGDWNILEYFEKDGRKFCYALMEGVNLITNFKEARKPHIVVILNHNLYPSFKVNSGYSVAKGSDVKISVNGYSVGLESNGEQYAWTYKNTDDIVIIENMLSEKSMLILSVSRHGKYAVDSYSLESFQAVFHRLMQLCSK